MRQPPRLHPANAWLPGTAALILAMAFAPNLPAATVITGDVTPALPWSTSTSARIGNTADGTLAVNGGSQLDSNNAFLGYDPNSTGTATVTGAGSKWTTSSVIYVGNSGRSELRVEAGGHVSSATGHLGFNSGSTGTATVTGAGSKWTNSTNLWVGFNGTGALTVEDGGQVTTDTLFASLEDLHGNGTVMAATGAVLDADLQFNAAQPAQAVLGFGAGGTLTLTAATGRLGAGYKGLGTLTISEGVSVSSSFGYLGYQSGSTGTATITGAGSKWSSSGLFVGYAGNGTLTVEDGGHVATVTLYASLDDLHGNGTIAATRGAVLDANLRFDAGSPAQAVFGFDSGGTLTVTPTVGGGLGAGYKRYGSLTISEGVAVSSSSGYLGYNAGSTGTATTTGAGSKWTHSSSLYVGYDGSGALRVEAGGQVINTSSSINFGSYLGYNAGSTGTATITGVGSSWTTPSTFLDVGRSGRGELRVEAGGLVSNSEGNLGSNAGSTGAATIIGAGSTWTNSSVLRVGRVGNGSLRVEAGGLVSNTIGYLGANANSKGAAMVTGAGSKWINSSALYVGLNGGGTITITDGGLVSVRGTLTIDSNGGNDSFINMATGGMLALWGDADDSLAQFLGLVSGADAIRCWSPTLATWSALTAATLGVDYTLQYQTAGDLSGYTLLTVLAVGMPGDFNYDNQVDGADLLAWQRGASPTPHSPADLAAWRTNFGLAATTPATTAVPEPGACALTALALAGLLLTRRPRR